MLDASCGSRSPLWRELYPAKGVARAQHASVNLGGGLLSMVAGQVMRRLCIVPCLWGCDVMSLMGVRVPPTERVMCAASQVPADDPSWHVVATWNRTANAQQSVRLTNSIAVMDLASCFPTSSECLFCIPRAFDVALPIALSLWGLGFRV